MGKVYFLIGIHNHQPVGNFEHVFSQAYDECYSPLLQTLLKFPKVKFSVHHSGPLLEWIEKHKAEYIGEIKKLVKDGRAEIMSGGFYEPILSALPERDAIGQIEMMNEWIKKNFGQKPQGAWLAERIWDPALPGILSAADVKYTLLDDTHFNYAGLSENDMRGYYVTERHGKTAAVFPIDKFLRYSIPFKQPEETLEYFRGLAEKFGDVCVTYGDDGEKFGLWPETYDWVYKRKWLERFFQMIEANGDLIETVTFSECIERFPATGRIYLPMASYEEMMHWTLPTGSAIQHTNALNELKNSGKMEAFKPFIRGGLWDNFLVKYEESNALHKRMIYASGRAEKALKKSGNKKLGEEIQRELYKGQCNCPYWHGLFGGLYLSNLRHAVYTGLINSGKAADKALHGKKEGWVELTREDYFKTGQDAVIAETSNLFALIDPANGGTVAEIDYKPASFNLSNVLTRMPEEYHQKIIDSVSKESSDETAILSPHDRVAMKSEGLEKKLVFDDRIRNSFMDRFMDFIPDAERLRAGLVKEKSDFAIASYSIESVTNKRGVGAIELASEGSVATDSGTIPISISKTYSINGKNGGLKCSYAIENNGDVAAKFVFGVEWNFTLLADDALDRYVTIEKERYKMNSQGDSGPLKGWSITDEYFRLNVEFSSANEVTLARYPVETVSQSEGGFEANYQGTAFVAMEQLSLEPGEKASRCFGIKITSI